MNTTQTVPANPKPEPALRPHPRTVRRKIGRTTYTVTSRFQEGREKDIVSTIARLIEYDVKNI
ncbi:MAG: transposon-encoded TnpW family protein [Oscillospiraceae bacterium]|nr:transposon-encoded TnpW family protein [Oscillospiraceae bacterium]